MPKKVLVPIANGVEEIESVSIIDVLRRAGAEVTVASVHDELQITASRGVRLVADKLLSQCSEEDFDLIVLPGGLPGAEHLRDCKLLTHLLRSQQQKGKWYGAICAAPVVVLESHGLLGTRRATCHPSFSTQLQNQEAAQSRVVVDGNCVTSQAPGTAIEFALTLVELLLGQEKAKEVAAPMQVKAN